MDQLGLDAVDRRMLRSIISHYGGGPVGLETLAATVGEEAVTLEDVYEPYLMQMGFLTRTPGAGASPAWPMSTWGSPSRGRSSCGCERRRSAREIAKTQEKSVQK